MKVPIFLNGIARLQKIVTTIFNAVFLRRISSVKKREKNRILACQNDFVETTFFILTLLAPLITRHSNWNTYRLLWWVQLLQNSFKNFPRRKAQVDLKTRNCTSITISKFRILCQYVCNSLKKKNLITEWTSPPISELLTMGSCRNRLEENLWWIVPHVPPTNQSVRWLNWPFFN